jgi:hypothetical protein
MRLRRSRRTVRVVRAVLASTAGGALIAASLAGCGPTAGGSASGGSADTTSSATAASSTTPDDALDSMPFGSIGGGFVPLPGGSVASVPVGAGETVTVPVAGHGGVPASGAGAVAVAVATMAGSGGSGSGSVTVYPAGGSQPDAPSLSWPGGEATTGQAASGLAVSGLGDAGSVAVHNSSGHQVTVSLDADGYWLAGTPAAAGAFGPLTGGRVARVAVAGGQTVSVPVAGHGGVPTSGAGTVALTAGVSSAFGAGSVTVYPDGASRPDEPDLSWAAGGTTASGLVVSALSSHGTVAVHNSSFLPVTVTLDATGYWLSGAPAAAGTFGPAGGGRVARVRVGAGQTVRVPVAGQAGVPAAGAGAAALAVTVPAGQPAGSVTLYPAGASRPDVASLSWAARGAAAGLAVAALSDDGAVAVHNSSAEPVTVTLAAVGYWLVTGRTVSDVVAKPTTVTLTGADIVAVAGDPAATETVTLAAGVTAPAVGRVLTAPVSATAPAGLLGTVTAVTDGADGTHVVTLSPATLDQAYSTFDVSTSQALTNSDVVQAPSGQTGPGGQTQSTEATPMSGTHAAAPADSPTSGFGFNISKASFTCKGSDDSAITLTADLSKINVDLSIDANPSAPNIHFLITADPVFDINVDFAGTVTCELADAHFLQAHILVPATPGLMVDLNPVLTFDAHGDVSIDFQWAPRAALGFDKGPGISSEVNGFGSSGNVTITATADADLYMGLHADISLAGRVGVGGDFGPDLPASYDSGTGCVTVDGRAKADLTADADVFVKSWSFTLASGTFDERQLFHKCGAQATPSSPSSSSPAPSDPSSSPTGQGAVGWTAIEGPLPANAATATDPGGNVTGVSCVSGASCVIVGDYYAAGIVGSGELLTGSGGSWTSSDAPLPPPAIIASGPDAGGNVLASVSCPSASQCVAVGTHSDELSGGAATPELLTGTSGSWVASKAPLPADDTGPYAGGSLNGISCPSTSGCVAVGSTGVLTDSDGTWTAAEPPLPANVSTDDPYWSLNAVSCSSTSHCVAVGNYFQQGVQSNGAGAGEGLLLTDSDGTWTAAEAPLPANAATTFSSVQLDGVSCPSASQCVAVGSYEDASGNSHGLILTGNGASWTAAEASVPANALATGDEAGAELLGISCPSMSQCVAVGWYEVAADGSDGNGGGGLLLTDSGGTWTAAQAPVPANAGGVGGGAGLAAVSCSSASQCVAGGDYDDASIPGGFRNLIVTLG